MAAEDEVLAWCGHGLAAVLILGSAMRASPVLAQAPAVAGGRAEVVGRLAELGRAAGVDADWERALAAYEGRVLAEPGGVARQARALRDALEEGGLPALGIVAAELAGLAEAIAAEFDAAVRPAIAAGWDLSPARRLLAAWLALAVEEGAMRLPGEGAGGGGDV
ncbi:MAG: hypothetical protein K6U87_14400 [Firmicutes bacterium]|nr:hypothetical protein [Bacillota bacterium]